MDDIITKVEEIISGDKINELQELIKEKDINTFNTITKSFLEVKKMKIPLIQYCMIKNAIKCFKFIIVNGYDDPNRTMEDQNPFFNNNIHNNNNIGREIRRYEWDCMAKAIYLGNEELINLLDLCINRGSKPAHFEAALLSYRNTIAKQLIEHLNENNNDVHNILNLNMISSIKSNNIKGVELLISLKGADINAINIIYLNILILFLIKII